MSRRLTRSFVFLLAFLAVCVTTSRRADTQSTLRRITTTTEEGVSLNPSMSGDGRVVAFESTEDLAGAGGVQTFRAIREDLSVDPATFVQLARSRAPAPAVSQDGSRITFASKDDPVGTNADGNSEIFLYDTAKLIQITNTQPSDTTQRVNQGNFSPSISDDGRFVAFSSNRNPASFNADANLEIFVFDVQTNSFEQLTSSSGISGCSDAKISGDGGTVAYLRNSDTSRDLLLQNRTGTPIIHTIASDPTLVFTFGRAISDDGQRVVWSEVTGVNATQVFLYDGKNNLTRQITNLGTRATDVPLHPTISGNGNKIAFATRRSFQGNTDGGVDLYTYDIASATFARVTAGPATATADVLSSMNDDGSLVAFNYPRVLTGVSNPDFANNSEIYVTATPARPPFGTLTILNGASFGHEPATTEAVAPESIAVARGSALAFTTEQSKVQSNGTFPSKVGGTTVTINGRAAQIFFVSPSQVNFLVPPQTELGTAEVIVTNSDGFPSRGTISVLRAAPGIFTYGGDGLGEGVILNGDTLLQGPFDPTSGHLRLIVFATGGRNGVQVTATAGGRDLIVESIVQSPNTPGFDEIHLRVPADLRGAGTVDLVVRADGRDSNAVSITFSGDAARDIVINEFLADPPGTVASDTAGDANQDGTRSASADEFVELVNSTTRDLDISGYQILTRAGAGSADVLRHTFLPGTILPSCSAIVIFGGGSPNPSNPAFGGGQIQTASTGAITLNNTSGSITVREATGVVVSFVTYGGSSGLNADENQSQTRSPDIIGAFAKHSIASGGGRLFSPGTKLNGLPFALCTVAIARVEISPPSASIEIGANQQFIARAFDSGNNEIPAVIFTWESNNTSVGSINQNGLATGVTAGSTSIRATGRGVPSGPVTLNVTQAPPVLTSISITPASATVLVNESQQFTAQAKDQYGQDFGGVTIKFVSNNTSVASVDTANATTPRGSATATITGRSTGSAQIRASATNGSATVLSFPATLTVEPGAGQLLISEFRTRGPAGAADEFVEVYNPTTSTINIGGLRLRASNSSGIISDRVTITPGSTLGAGCHYLVANNGSGGYSGATAPNQTYGTGITDDGGIAITSSNGTSVIDAVGMSNGSTFKESATLTPLAGSSDQSYERKPRGSFGNGIDTNNNSADFVLTTPANPQNTSSTCLNTSSADLSIAISDSPDPVTAGSNITYAITVTNNGAAAANDVVVTNTLPGVVSFVSCDATNGGVCGGAGNSRTISFSSLQSGASATIIIVVTANGPAGATVSNAASVASTTADLNIANNSVMATTFVRAPVPLLTIDDVSHTEGEAGTTTFTFSVTLSSPAPAGGVAFDIGTQDETANSNRDDYVTKSLSGQTIAAGSLSYSFDVTVNGDVLVEPTETFFVNITNVSNATVADAQGVGTILNDDVANAVISQLYGGGGNAGAQFKNDFIEIFNRGATTVDLAGWSVQYNSATGAGNWSMTPLCTSGPCLLLPGKYFLVQEAVGAGGTLNLPPPDATGSIAMTAGAGKVAVVSNTTALSGSCPVNAFILDLIGYGGTASCFEGPSPAPAPGNTVSDVRFGGGCVDTDQNSADFFTTTPGPRNSSFPANTCGGQTVDLSINDVTVTEGDSGTVDAMFTVTLHGSTVSTVTVDYATANGTAQSPADYQSTTSQLVFNPGVVTRTITVAVEADTLDELDETFFVNLSNATNAALLDNQGQGTIADNDVPPMLSVTDVSQSETNSGTTTFAFNVHLSAPALTGGVTFDIATVDDTAQDGEPGEDNDYVAGSLTNQIIPAGGQDYTFNVTVNGDTTIEASETFFVNVTNVSGALVGDAQGQATIQNDDSPSITIADVSMNEGDSGTTTYTFTVTSSLPAPAAGIIFDIATADGTAQDDNPATEDNDYVAKSLTGQTIQPAQSTYTFTVSVNSDTIVEPNQTFFVNITNVTGASVTDAQAQGTILNDDTPNLIISQIYPGGNNAGATYRNDFIEIFNRGSTTIDFSITPYSIQYAGATAAFGASNTKTDITSGTIAPGHYFLIQEAGGTTNGVALPMPDAIGNIAMAATGGKVALVSGTTALATTCPGDDPSPPTNPSGNNIVDVVGYGSGGNAPNCFEGTGPAAFSTSTAGGLDPDARSMIRTNSCVDTNNNSADFSNPTTAPVARNSATPAARCP